MTPLRILVSTLLLLSFGSLAQQQPFSEAIQPQPLSDAVREFADKTGLQIVFESELTQGKHSKGAVPSQSNKEMLDQLLSSTGVDFVFLNDNTVALREPVESGANLSEKAELLLTDTQLAQVQVPADDTGEGPTDGDGAGQAPVRYFEEVLVRAQIREESLQEIPVSGTAFSGATLAANRLDAIDDIAHFTPGLTGSFFNYSSPIIAVRGANNTFSQAGASKPVGVFLDGVFIPRYSASSFDLFDLEQVTVLRGPQGTLFGRNVTGGAIQITSAQPQLGESDFQFRVGAGNYGLGEFAGFASGQLSETSAGKVSLSYKDRDGFAVDRFNGQELENLDSINLRAGLLFSPGDDIDVRLSADVSSDKTGGRSYSFLSSNDGTNRTGNDGNNRTAELRVPQSYERDIRGVSAHVDWTTAFGTFQSISAYRQSEAREVYSLGAADVTLPSVATQFLKDEIDEPTSFSQEIRFISDPSETFDFVAGLYFYSEDTKRVVGDTLLGVNGRAVFVNRSFNVNAETSSTALYANVNFHVADNLDLGIGGRYTTEAKDVRVDYVDNNRPTSNFVVSPSDEFSEFTPRITLTYFAGDSVTLFASRTEGFTAGGFNTETNSAAAIQLGFEPETITAYELGAKTAWAEGRFIANLTLFDQQYENKQEGFFTRAGPYFSIFNASEATMQGAEVELSWAMTEALTASATYSALDTVYDHFIIPLGADYTGNKLQTAPESKASIILDYAAQLENGNMLLAGFSYSSQGDYYTGASNAADFLIDGYSLFNARLGYEWANGRWRADLWGKNLGDEDYVRIRGNSGALAEYFGAPRTYGINLTYRSE